MNAKATFRRPEVSGVIRLIARVWLRWQFLTAEWAKTSGHEQAVWIGDQAGMAVPEFLGLSLTRAPGGQIAGDHPEVTSWYAARIRHAFLPNAEVFSYLVARGELLVGIALNAGIFTRFAAAMGLMMNLSYLLAGVSGLNPFILLIEIPLVLVGTTASSYALDRYLLPLLQAECARLPRLWRIPTPASPAA